MKRIPILPCRTALVFPCEGPARPFIASMTALDPTLSFELKQDMRKTTVTFRVTADTAETFKKIQHGKRGIVLKKLLIKGRKIIQRYAKVA